MRIAILLGLASTVLCGQQPDVQQKTSGPCSVAIVGSNNQVFTCKGMDQKLGDQILRILNTIAGSQMDPDIVMAKLDEIQEGVNEIRDTTAPRTIDDAAFSRLVTAVSPYENQEATIMYIASDNEARRLADRIYQALLAADWSVAPPSAAMIFPAPGAELPGVRLSAAQETPAGSRLLNALHAEGLSVAGTLRTNIDGDAIHIVVYGKP